MAKQPGAEGFVPHGASLTQLGKAIQSCEGCDLFRHATQAVFGEGHRSPHIVMVGEQPGDQEDRQGHPFVGPAGAVLDRALEDAEIDRDEVYITNAVKHFKFEERGKRRLHKKPSSSEIEACRPWLDAELALIRPRMIVCLGATAAQAVIGKAHRLLENRGRFFPHTAAPQVTATVHPSSILRAPDEESRKTAYAAFVADLAAARRKLIETSG